MSRPEPDSVVSQGVQWASRITTIGLEFALPALLGGYLDRRWGIAPTLTIVGALLGITTGMIHILAIAREGAKALDRGRRPTGAGGHANDNANASEPGSTDDA